VMPVFRSGLENFRRLSWVGDVRSIGMIGALELVRDKKTRAMFDFRERIGLRIYKEGLKENVIMRPLGNIIYFYLPLCVGEPEITAILKKTFFAFRNAESRRV
ncbi:MAG: hypothetical protein Q8R48_01975, partial [Candidatus Omnitrophota bacterium]|nr:hypothetical protein [Candidatus Omnitrophota bacterium]